MKQFKYRDEGIFYDGCDYYDTYGYFYIYSERKPLYKYSKEYEHENYEKIILLFIPLMKS